MKVFVTGGAGFIGSVVIRVLTGEGHQVRCLLRSTTDTRRIDAFPFERAIGDVRDFESVRAGMTGCDAAIHMASLSSWDQIDSPEMPDVVVNGIRHVLRAAHEFGDLRVVHVSSAAVLSGSTVPRVLDESAPYTLNGAAGYVYAHAKHAAEQVCREYSSQGVPIVVVLPAETYGPNDTALVTAGNLVEFVNGSPVLVCRGGSSIAHVEDVARGIVGALRAGRPGERYILGGENVDWRRLAGLTLRHAGRSKKIVTVANSLFRAATNVLTACRIPLPYNPKVVPYATRYWYVDASKARNELGVSFRSADDTVKDTVQWLRSSGHFRA